MPRCSLCKTQYAKGVDVCKIDGTHLSGDDHALAAPGKGKAYSVLVSGGAPARGKGGGGLGLNSMSDDEVTTAAKPPALAARAMAVDAPPRLATGSATVAPESKHADKWAAPFVEEAPIALEHQRSEEWVGQTLGSYKLLSILGKGGMGCVYRAEHTKLGRDVALKVLRTDYAQRKDAVARFFQEARAVNKIRHRNIVDVTDLVELDNGIVFIIMEYLRGAPLGKIMHKSKPALDPVRILRILIQICDGLGAAHEVGIVHRDLKPDNIIVVDVPGEQELVKVLDFGVAKLLDKSEGDDMGLMTVAGSVVGTPAFMSPEQAGGLQVDGRADLYSLGAIMYEMFTQSPIFHGKSFGEYVRMHLNDIPVRPSQTPDGGHIGPELEHIIMRCLEKSPDARFQNALDLSTALRTMLASFEAQQPMAYPALDSAAGHAMAAQQPMAQQPMAQQPMAQQPMAQQPMAQQPMAQQPMAQQPMAQQPMAQQKLSNSYSSEPGMEMPGVPADQSGRQASRGMSSEPFHGYGLDSGISNPPQYPVTGLAQSYTGPSLQPQGRRTGFMIAGGACLVGVLAVLATRGDSSTDQTEYAKQSMSAAETFEPEVALTAPDKGAPTKPEQPVKPTQPVKVAQPDKNEPGSDRFVEIRLRSEPSAAVYLVGSLAPVCIQTPCQLRIDTRDGSSKERDYAVRSDGYLDSIVRVNLQAPREEILVTLEAKGTQEKIEQEKIEQEKIEQEKIEQEKIEQEKIEQEKIEQEKIEQEKIEQEKIEQEKIDAKKRTKKPKPVRKRKRDLRNKRKEKPATKETPKCKAGAQDTFNPFDSKKGCQ